MAFKGDDVSPEKKTGFTFRGKEIILSKTRGRPLAGLARKGMDKGIWPDQKYIEAATLFAVTGDMTVVEELTDIPYRTLMEWKKEEAFLTLLLEIREENDEKIDAKFTEILEKTLEQALDRLENGETFITKKGEVVHVPPKLRDLTIAMNAIFDKRQLLRGKPTARTEKISTVADRLETLANQFEKIAQKAKLKTIEVIDVPFTEVQNASRVGTEAQEASPPKEANG